MTRYLKTIHLSLLGQNPYFSRLGRLHRLTVMTLCGTLAACSRPPEPAPAEAAAGTVAIMFNFATHARLEALPTPDKETEQLLVVSIPNLLVRKSPGAFLSPYSASFRGSSSSLDNYPNTWLFSGPDGELCVATAVGPRSVLTAGHCVDANKVYALKQPSTTLQAKCKSLYPGEPSGVCKDTVARSQDLAICQLTPGQADLPMPKWGYETIDAKSPAPALQSEVEVVTFTSCADGPPLDNVNPVKLALTAWPVSPGKAVADASGPAAKRLCAGDSGAPWLHPSAKRVVAVHVCKLDDATAWGAALDGADARTFLSDSDRLSPLCGLSAPAALCRQ